MSHRSWFPTILFGLSILLACVFLLFTKHGQILGPAPVNETAQSAVTVDSYHAAVNAILDAYAGNHDAQKAYNALILLRLPASQEQVHFDLVVAFSKLSLKDTKDGQARLDALKAANPWLHL